MTDPDPRLHAGERESLPPADRRRARVRAHLLDHLGPPAGSWEEPCPGAPTLELLHFPARGDRRFAVLATCGMSARPLRVPPGTRDARFVELVLSVARALPDPSDPRHAAAWPLRWLGRIAQFPHRYRSWFWKGLVLPNGSPSQAFGADTDLCAWMVVAPEQLGPSFTRGLRVDGESVRWMGLLGLHADELRFQEARGSRALAARLRATGVTEVLDPRRRSCLRSRWTPWRRG